MFANVAAAALAVFVGFVGEVDVYFCVLVGGHDVELKNICTSMFDDVE